MSSPHASANGALAASFRANRELVRDAVERTPYPLLICPGHCAAGTLACSFC
jgi:hypothetical protein